MGITAEQRIELLRRLPIECRAVMDEEGRVVIRPLPEPSEEVADGICAFVDSLIRAAARPVATPSATGGPSSAS